VVIVATCVLLGARLFAAADDTVGGWSLRHDVPAGSRLEAGDLSVAHGDERRPLTDLTQIVLEEAARISNLAADIESHMNLPRPAQRGPRSVTRYASVLD